MELGAEIIRHVYAQAYLDRFLCVYVYVKGKDKEWENYGSIVVPARRLDETLTINGVSITQRKYLAQKVAELAAVTNTPTASAYAETAAYLLGTSTKMSGGYFGFESSNENAKNILKDLFANIKSTTNIIPKSTT